MIAQRRSLATELTPNRRSVDRALEPRLLLYAVAGGAFLASAPSARAEVIFTPSNAVLQGGNANLAIDLDNDGSADFTIAIENCRTYSGYGIGRCLEAHGQSRSDEVGMHGRFLIDRLAQALSPRTPVNGGHKFRRDAVMASVLLGEFWNVADRYLGVRFRINGQVHYGWIGFRRVRIDWNGAFSAALGGWAYETNPDTTILAGDTGTAAPATGFFHPTSLEILSSGHVGIEERRQRTSPTGGH